jgi:hypothetical protein
LLSDDPGSEDDLARGYLMGSQQRIQPALGGMQLVDCSMFQDSSVTLCMVPQFRQQAPASNPLRKSGIIVRFWISEARLAPLSTMSALRGYRAR